LGHSFLHSGSPPPASDVLPSRGEPFIDAEAGAGGGGGRRDLESSGVGGFKSIEGGAGGGGGRGGGGRDRL